MSYEEFTEEVEATTEAKEKIVAFAAIQTDGTTFCPRCGNLTVKERLHTNALSRHANVYVCDGCGMDEAMVKAVTNPFVTSRTTRKVGLGIPLLLLFEKNARLRAFVEKYR